MLIYLIETLCIRALGDNLADEINSTKCVVLRVSPKKTVLQTQYMLHGHTLEVVDSSKYLGVTIKDDLSWETHVQNTVGKANRTLGFLRRNMKDCTMPMKDLTIQDHGSTNSRICSLCLGSLSTDQSQSFGAGSAESGTLRLQ